MPQPELPQPSLKIYMQAARDAARQWFAAERAGAEHESYRIREIWQWDIFFQLFTGDLDPATFYDQMGQHAAQALALDEEFKAVRRGLPITKQTGEGT